MRLTISASLDGKVLYFEWGNMTAAKYHLRLACLHLLQTVCLAYILQPSRSKIESHGGVLIETERPTKYIIPALLLV